MKGDEEEEKPTLGLQDGMPTLGQLPILGQQDVGPSPATDPGSPEGGMIMGPDHPIFNPPPPARHAGYNRPPGARWDPINPIHPTGDIDPDELLPPGQFEDPIHPGVRPRGRPTTGGRPPIGRPPRDFPPGPGGGSGFGFNF